MPPFLLRSFTVVCLLLLTPAWSPPPGRRGTHPDPRQALELAAAHNRAIARAQNSAIWRKGCTSPSGPLPCPSCWSRDAGSRGRQGPRNTGLRPARGCAATRPGPVYLGRGPGRIRAAKIGLLTADERLRASRQEALRDTSVAFTTFCCPRNLNSVFTQNLAQRKPAPQGGQGAAGGWRGHRLRRTGCRSRREQRPPEWSGPTISSAAAVTVCAWPLAWINRSMRRAIVRAAGRSPDYEEALAIARERRPELRDLRHRIGIAEELVTIARAGDKPRVDLTGNYGWKELDADSTISTAKSGPWAQALLAHL